MWTPSAARRLISAQAERGFGRRDALCWEDVAWIRDRWPGTLLLKGILAPEDAARAELLGIDGIIVSNHGGRQLDGPCRRWRRCPTSAMPPAV